VNYLFVSDSNDGWRNLAVDEYFLDHIGPDDALLFFYINANAVIIGRSQNPWAECDLKRMEADGVQLVRRITGGGAVYHDRGNLNFSFIMGKDRYDQKKQLELILSAVRALGIPCEFSGRNDLLANGRKFSGNAFCVRGGARQHHGTLLVSADLGKLQRYLHVDPRKLHSKGTRSVRARVCNLSDHLPGLTCERLLHALIAAYGEQYGDYRTLTSGDLDEAAIAPYMARQASAAWRLGETPKFDLELEDRFAWGNIQLLFESRHGVVENLGVYTDANDADLAETVKERLCGAAFGSRPMAAALRGTGRPELEDIADFILRQGL